MASGPRPGRNLLPFFFLPFLPLRLFARGLVSYSLLRFLPNPVHALRRGTLFQRPCAERWRSVYLSLSPPPFSYSGPAILIDSNSHPRLRLSPPPADTAFNTNWSWMRWALSFFLLSSSSVVFRIPYGQSFTLHFALALHFARERLLAVLLPPFPPAFLNCSVLICSSRTTSICVCASLSCFALGAYGFLLEDVRHRFRSWTVHAPLLFPLPVSFLSQAENCSSHSIDLVGFWCLSLSLASALPFATPYIQTEFARHSAPPSLFFYLSWSLPALLPPLFFFFPLFPNYHLGTFNALTVPLTSSPFDRVHLCTRRAPCRSLFFPPFFFAFFCPGNYRTASTLRPQALQASS